MADLWKRLPWWGKSLVVLGVLFMLGVVVYVILKNALIIVFGVLLVFGIWCVFRNQKSRGTIRHDKHHKSGHDSDDEVVAPVFEDTTEEDGPARREYDHPYGTSRYHSDNEVHVYHHNAVRGNQKRERSRMALCARCDGQGSYVYFGLRRTCDACGGTGSVRAGSRGPRSSGGQVVHCGRCDGQGSYVNFGLRQTCDVCRGSGRVRV